MWRDKQDLQAREPDSPMKQMARLILASEASEAEESPAHIRQANLADRFGQGQGPVQDFFANLEAQEEATAKEAASPRPASLNAARLEAEVTYPVAPSPSSLGLAASPAAVKAAEVNPVPAKVQEHPMLRPVLYRPSPQIRPQVKEAARQILGQNRKTQKRRSKQVRFTSLQDALLFSRDQFPLPKEIQARQKPEHRTWLLSQVQACHNEAALRRFAYSLSTKDLSILFPSLASLKTGPSIDKLLRIIALRASNYLYLQGWVTLQYTYPRSTVQKGLALLCEILEDKAHRPPDDLANLSYQGLQLGPERFDWAAIHLISEISLPNTRHFMSSIIKYLRDSGNSGREFFQRYGIYRDLALGQAIISQWDMAVFESNLHSNNPLQNLF